LDSGGYHAQGRKVSHQETKEIQDQTPEESRLEAELARERQEEARRAYRPALRRLLESLEQEEVKDEDESD